MDKSEISTYELALFDLIRRDMINKKPEYGETDEEINEVAYRSIGVLMSGIRFDRIKTYYDQGKKLAEQDK